MNIWKGKVLSEVPFGHVLVIAGKIKPNPNKICLDLTDNIKDSNESETIFLKIEANFKENQIIRSMYQPGEGWQQEEISKNWKSNVPKNPLVPANFKENQIIRSMYQPGEGWQQEEISKNWKSDVPKNPLVPGQTFNFRVAVLQKCFEIYVNDNLYGTFEYLQCPKKINYVMVYGDFEKITQFHHRMLFPLVFPRNLLSCEKLAFQSDVPKKYETGTVVAMECIARGPRSTEFSICFQCNETSRVVFKFHVNFETRTVVRSFQREDNSFNSADEETDGDFPFVRGNSFKIAFGQGDKAFIVAVNGKYFTYFNFPFRNFSISTVKCLCSYPGDFAVNKLEYHADSPLLKRVEKLSAIE